MKQTLLELTQDILSSMGSDEVNSIGDTVESLQVANIIRQTYFNMIGRYDLPEHNKFITLIPSDDASKPTLMTRPDGVSRIESVMYFDTNPLDGNSLQQDQFGAFSHGLNLDIQNQSHLWTTTSNSTVTIGVGVQTFTVSSGLNITIGDDAFAYAGPMFTGATSMSGTVIGYVGTTLTLNITATAGVGTFSAWRLSSASQAVFGPGYLTVQVIPIDQFITMVNRFDPSETNVGSFELVVDDDSAGVVNTPSSFLFYYKNDRQPQYCTVISNYWIVFDSFDNTQDSTLQASKTMVMAWMVPTFQMVDTFMPDLNEQHFPLLLNDAKSLAFQELKQLPHQKAEDEVARQLVSLQKWKAISGKPTYFDELPSFGRHGSLGTIVDTQWMRR